MRVSSWASAALAGALALPLAASAAGGSLSASLTVTSDYVFRGVSQTLEEPALQGGFHFEHRNGLLAGAWASTVDSPSYQLPAGTRDAELDVYLGYGRELRGPWSLVGSIVRYQYDAEEGYDYDYLEWGLALQRGPVSLAVSWSRDGLGFHGDSVALELLAHHRLARRLELSGGVGRYALGRGGEVYVYWNLTLARPFGPLVVDLGYYDTDSTAERLWPGLAAARVVLAATYRLR